MKKCAMTEEELIEYFENNDLGDEMREADKRGDLFFCKPGENVFEAAKRHRAEKAQATKPAPAFSRTTTRRHVAAATAM